MAAIGASVPVQEHRFGPSRYVQRAAAWNLDQLAVCLLVIGIVTIRFFTERLSLLPRVLNALDIAAVPMLLFLVMLSLVVRRRGMPDGRRVILLSSLFVIAWAVSWLANADAVHWIAGLLLPAGLLSPIFLYIVFINLTLPPSFCARLIAILKVLLICNLIIGSVEAVRGIGSGAVDIVYGTFGLNIDQYAFFLALMLAYFVAMWLYHEKARWSEVFIIGWTGTLFLVAAFQTLWVLFPISALITFVRGGGLSRRLVVGAAVVAIVMSLGWPLVPSEHFDLRAKFEEMVTDFDELGKVELIRNVPSVWAYQPSSVVFGVGPGTFNSRAFRSIAMIPYPHYTGGIPREDVSAAIMDPFYTSEVSERFIIPYFLRGFYRLSGPNTDAPFTSFVSIPIEVGIPGAIAFFGIYWFVVRQLDRSLRHSTDRQQKVLSAWALTSMLMLLGLAAVDNSLEVTRYTLLAWLPAGIWAVYSKSLAPRLPRPTIHGRQILRGTMR